MTQANDDGFFRNFAREQAAEIELTRDTLLNGFELAGEAVRMFPGSGAIREFHTLLAEQLHRIELFERTEFDDRPMGFLEAERELFDTAIRGIIYSINAMKSRETKSIEGAL